MIERRTFNACVVLTVAEPSNGTPAPEAEDLQAEAVAACARALLIDPAKAAELYAVATRAEQSATAAGEVAARIRDPALYALGRALFDAMLDLRATLNAADRVPDDPRERWKYGSEVDAAYFRLAACDMELDRAVKARGTSQQQRTRARRLHKPDIVVAAARERIEREGKHSPAKVVKDVLAPRLDGATLSRKTLIRFLENSLGLWPWPNTMDKATALSILAKVSNFQ